MIPGRGLAGGVVLAAAAFAAAVGFQMVRDRIYPREQAQQRAVMYVQSPVVLRRLALSYDALVADVYWIRALQHYGGERLSRRVARKYDLLYPLLDLTTSLDPYFTIAYRFGAIFLSEPPPGGPGQTGQAVALLKKGIAAQPTKWQYYHDLAFVYYWQLHDLKSAAQWFRLAQQQPGAPNWLEPVAASLLIQGGDRASARFLLQQILKSEEPWLQRMATRGLLQIDALDVIDQLRVVIGRNRPPPGETYSWEGLIRRGALRGVPLDPTGLPYEIDPDSGAVSVSRRSELSPMPTRRDQ